MVAAVPNEHKVCCHERVQGLSIPYNKPTPTGEIFHGEFFHPLGAEQPSYQ